MATTAQKAEIQTSHAVIGKMLHNTHYLGDDYYPVIVDPATYTAAEAERIKRATKLGRIFEPREEPPTIFLTVFRLVKGTKQYDDPFLQAE